jgi:hypothetical protein
MKSPVVMLMRKRTDEPMRLAESLQPDPALVPMSR